jgi:hypothetical protein
MASKKALAFLHAMGIQRVHTALELSNFSAGKGNKPFSLPYHVIAMDYDRSGDSKRTVDWAKTLDSALACAREYIRQNDAMNTQCGADTLRQDRTTYYVRDIRDGKVYRA